MTPFNTFHRLALRLVGLGSLILAAPWGFAQSRAQAPVVPQYGPHFYAIETLGPQPNGDEENGNDILRGKTSGLGFAHDAIILAPNTRYREWILNPRTRQVAVVEFTTPDNGQRFRLPQFIVLPTSSADDDGDGLHAEAEFILATDAANPDTDADGIRDGVEIQQGSNPMDGRPVATGVIAAADTPGIAVDVSALNNVVAVADSAAGVALFDVSAINPVLASQVNTPGDAQRVAWSGSLLAVADRNGGLAVIDVANPSNAQLVHQVPVGDVSAVTAAAGLAYVGLQSGQIAVIDMTSGNIMRRLSIGQPVWDLALGDYYLYALTDNTLFTVDVASGDLLSVGSVPCPFVSTPNRRLSVGGPTAYAVHGKGYNTFDLADPARPRLIAAGNTSQFGWEHIVPNGSGSGVAAVGTAFAFDQQRVFSLYDLSDPQRTDRFIFRYTHPGHARAVSIFNGLAYGAAHDAGLQVINYRAFDTGGQPPTINLTADFPLNPAQAEEGKLVRVTANVTDDVQVRHVEFYVNGSLAATDGNFPFEYRFLTPSLLNPGDFFTVRAVAFDTGGNSSETPLIQVALVTDATPPRLTGQSPQRGAIVGSSDSVAAFFNEPLNQSTISHATFLVTFAGSDGVLGNADDAVVPGGTLEYRSALNGIFQRFPSALSAGVYRVAVKPPLADLAGNPLAHEATWEFLVLGAEDTDQDGVPDNVESLMGLSPTNPDSDGDGLLDGDEDADSDGLKTAWELAYRLDPRKRDTDENGVFDGDEDTDNDSLTHRQELLAFTHPLRADTDGDGWPDEAEITGRGDALNSLITPPLMFSGAPPVEILAPAGLPPATAALGVTVATPQVAVTVPAAVFESGVNLGVFLAQPVVQCLVPAPPATTAAHGVIIGQPTVTVTLPGAGASAGIDHSTVLAQPAVEVLLPAPTAALPGISSTVLAQPPVAIEFNPP